MVPAMPQAGSTIRVRALQPADVPAARELFAAGMRETVVGGVRTELAQRRYQLGLLAVAALCQVGAAALGLRPEGSAAAALALLLLPFGAALVVYCVLPHRIASDYIAKSLATDMADPIHHFCEPGGGQFWVAVDDDAAGAVVGTVAVERVNTKLRHSGGFRWCVAVPPRPRRRRPPPCVPAAAAGRAVVTRAAAGAAAWRRTNGDAELRRMSVAPSARGRGVAKALFGTLRAWCEEHYVTRIVLSTTNMQRDACERLYPSLGFEAVHTAPIFGGELPCCSAVRLLLRLLLLG
jgi:GNAT superfamily N-acetyltransferase